MFYSIRHLTKFRYTAPVSESIMELRMQPRTENNQRCLSFQAYISPRARTAQYRDYLGNYVHHFDVPAPHRQLLVITEALVDVADVPEPPSYGGLDAWERLDAAINDGDYWEMLMPSHFARPSFELQDFCSEIGYGDRGVARAQDPMQLLRDLNSAIFSAIAYVPKSTKVDSPIEQALRERKGVCQDFAHIMIATLRHLGIPARYVSGYLFHRSGDRTRSAEGATHAWVEAFLPCLGWVGFDPTNSVLANDRHIRTAVGRDYADVPPSRGVYKGTAVSELTVKVRVAHSDAPPPVDDDIPNPQEWREALQDEVVELPTVAQQQQQQ